LIYITTLGLRLADEGCLVTAPSQLLAPNAGTVYIYLRLLGKLTNRSMWHNGNDKNRKKDDCQ